MSLTSANADTLGAAIASALGVTDAAAVAKWKNVAELLYSHFVTDAQVAPGIPVATTGGPAAQSGATTAPGTLT